MVPLMLNCPFCYSVVWWGCGSSNAQLSILLQCCMMGVCHLCIMLSVRAPLNPNEDHTSHDATVTQLLQEGIHHVYIMAAQILRFSSRF